LRWGRISLASRSAFAVRGGDPGAQGGLRVELLRSARWRSSLGLRWDRGRKEASSADLRGLGDVRGTLRLRLALARQLDRGWRLGGAVRIDALGRGGGATGEVHIGRDWRVSAGTGLGASLGLGFGSAAYLQGWFGVTPAQAQASGYAAYTPGAGPQALTLSLGGRTGLDTRWALFYGSGVSRLLPPAARSPLVRERTGWGFNAGLVMRI
jgi:outer membrane scaffolding protein for murein synthesis (MipA/OmpV family)